MSGELSAPVRHICGQQLFHCRRSSYGLGEARTDEQRIWPEQWREVLVAVTDLEWVAEEPGGIGRWDKLLAEGGGYSSGSSAKLWRKNEPREEKKL
uniref:Uncharacterized protein n=1 Tax=Sphaerodactylus townsendi TaxID=933632 RepID=A0ACB8ELL1_9SAUR